jgi:ABC-type Mn2+/Zn2+ transport system permease subunit
VIGGVASFIGFWIAYQWDWPVGPTDVVLLGMIYALGFVVKKLTLLFRPKSPA